MVVEDQGRLMVESMKQKLGVAVRSVQWSYAIFWSLSATQHRVLEWGDGYYNGDIKTRKTTQTPEVDADKLGLQRSKQLRKLYESLLDGKSETGSKRSSAALSPEDLSDLEWYYLVCMSFVFKLGQGLPGRALASGQTIWLHNAQYAESKVFPRSLLAKSASVQTVICFPHNGGVVELGSTDLVSEDPSLVQHIKTCLLVLTKVVCPRNPFLAPTDEDHDADHKFEATVISTGQTISEELNQGSSDDCSNDCCGHDNLTDDSFALMDDGLSHCVKDSSTSSGCISRDFVVHEKVSSPNRENLENPVSSDDDFHYKRAVSVILKSSNRLLKDQNFSVPGCKSSFMCWKKEDIGSLKSLSTQNILKKILFELPRMHSNRTPEKQNKGGKRECILRPRVNNMSMLNGQRREDGRYLLLKSMVPSANQRGKTTILNDTIEYLKELEARVDELESSTDFEGRDIPKIPDIMEKTSGNYERSNKRKACEIKETEFEPSKVVPMDMEVSIREDEVVIEVRCPWREYLLVDIMQAMNNLMLDTHTVNSHTLDGILNLTLKSKFREAFATPRMIKEALRKTVEVC